MATGCGRTGRAVWLPWSYAFVVQSVESTTSFGSLRLQPILVISGATGIARRLSTAEHLTGVGNLADMRFCLLGALHLYKRPPILVFLLMLLLTPLLGELLVSLRRPIFYDRTLIWTTIPLYLLLAFGLLQLRRKALIATGPILLCTVNLLSLQNYYQNFKKEECVRRPPTWRPR